jgi:hypothetical protein
MTDGDTGAVCPQCGSTAAVHSVQELAAQAQARLNGQQQMGGPGGQGGPAGPTPGWTQEPTAGPTPGWAQEPTAGPAPGSWQGGGWQDNAGYRGYGQNAGLGDDIAGLAMGAAGRFLGRAIGRRVERAMTEKILPTLQARGQQSLATQMEIAQRYPELRACLTDKVIFLAGGSRTAPMTSVNFATVTLEQADALVASLRDG